MCKVSVVTSIYNGEKYIAETIDSVINQTFTDWEYIIIDNASEDRGPEIIDEYAKKDKRIRFYRNETNIGQYANLNKAHALARGRYIAHLDADDLCCPQRLEKQYAYMEAHPELVLLGSGTDSFRDGKTFASSPGVSDTNKVRFISLFLNMIPHSSYFVRRESEKEYGIRYEERFTHSADYKFVLSMLSVGDVAALPEALIRYRVHPGQASNTMSRKLRRDDRIQIREYQLQKVPEQYRAALGTAVHGDLSDRKSIRAFTDAFVGYANACGVKGSVDELARDPQIAKWYQDILIEQTGSPCLLAEYARGPFSRPFWFLKRRGMSLIKRSLLRAEKI